MSLAHRNGQPKTLTLKGNFAAKSVPTRDAGDDAWKKLQNAVRGIFRDSATRDSMEELYQAVENMVLQKKAETLYRNLFAEFEDQVGRKRTEFVGEQWASTQSFLENLHKIWGIYTGHVILIRSIFLYLDRTYVMQSPVLLSIWDMALELFRQQFVLMAPIQERTIAGILNSMRQDRKDHSLSMNYRVELRGLMKMMLDLSLYKTVLEPSVFAESKRFYNEESIEQMSIVDAAADASGAVATFLQHVGLRIKEEQDRCNITSGYLDVGSRKELIFIVEDKLVRQNVSVLLSKGFNGLMEDKKREHLRTLYELLNRVQALDRLRIHFADYIKSKASEIVQNEAEDEHMIQNLLDFKSHVDDILSTSFEKNEMLANTVKESFENAINSRQNKPAELIAKYIDGLMRSSKREDTEVETALDKCLILFRYVQGKDVFEAFYKNDLARRLLLNKSASIDSEKSMLSKLKSECGSQFTGKLEAMFKDIDTSKMLMARFKLGNSSSPLPLDLNVHVLTSAVWPTQRPLTVELPDELMVCVKQFEDFYKKSNKGRSLTWQHNLSSCVLRAEFPKGQKELSLSLCQTAILLHFNSVQSLSYEDLKSRTRLEDAELKRNLQSLACGKVRVLTKSPKGKEVDDTDSFTVNEGFEHSQLRIKVNTIQHKETKEEQKDTSERVLSDRLHLIDAAIVRIMKTKLKFSHVELVAEVISQLKFKLEPADIKKQIASLMDREYMARDTDTRSYVYIA